MLSLTECYLHTARKNTERKQKKVFTLDFQFRSPLEEIFQNVQIDTSLLTEIQFLV